MWVEINTWLPISKGPPSSLVQLHTAVWTGDTRDTKPKAVIRSTRQRSAASCRELFHWGRLVLACFAGDWFGSIWTAPANL